MHQVRAISLAFANLWTMIHRRCESSRRNVRDAGRYGWGHANGPRPSSGRGPCRGVGPGYAAGLVAGISPSVVDTSTTVNQAPCGSLSVANRPNGLFAGP